MNIKRIIAMLMASMFTWTSVCFSVPPVYSVSVSEEYGTVKQRYSTTGEKTIIHIQDAHSNFSAQKNLANIICELLPQIQDLGYGMQDIVADGIEGISDPIAIMQARESSRTTSKNLNPRSQIPFIGIEGAIGEYDLKELRDFPLRDVKEYVAGEYVKDGKLIGAEYASIISDSDFTLFGVEDHELFKEDFKSFYAVSKQSEQIAATLTSISEGIEQLASVHYSEEVREFIAEYKAYADQQISLIDFIPTVYQRAADLDLDLFAYPSLVQFKEILALHTKANLALLEAELPSLVEECRKNKTIGSDVAAAYASYGKEALSLDSLIATVVSLARREGMTIDRYGAVHAFEQYKKKFSLLSIVDLQQDTLAISQCIANQLAQTESEINVLTSMWRHMIMNDLYSLKAQKKQVEAVRAERTSFECVSLIRDVNALLSASGLHQIDLANTQISDDTFSSIMSFYDFAEEREDQMIRNLLDHMESKDQSVGVLVAGGYHSEGIVQALRDQNVAFMTITPHLDSLTDIAYMDRMLGNIVSCEALLSSHITASQINAALRTINELGFADVLEDAHLEMHGSVVIDTTTGLPLEESETGKIVNALQRSESDIAGELAQVVTALQQETILAQIAEGESIRDVLRSAGVEVSGRVHLERFVSEMEGELIGLFSDRLPVRVVSQKPRTERRRVTKPDVLEALLAVPDVRHEVLIPIGDEEVPVDLQVPAGLALDSPVEQVTFVFDVDMTLTPRGTEEISSKVVKDIVRAFRLMKENPALDFRFILISGSPYRQYVATPFGNLVTEWDWDAIAEALGSRSAAERFRGDMENELRSQNIDPETFRGIPFVLNAIKPRVLDVLHTAIREEGLMEFADRIEILPITGIEKVTYDGDADAYVYTTNKEKVFSHQEYYEIVRMYGIEYLKELQTIEPHEANLVALDYLETRKKDGNGHAAKKVIEERFKKYGSVFWSFEGEIAFFLKEFNEVDGGDIAKRVLAQLQDQGLLRDSFTYFESGGIEYAKISLYDKAAEVEAILAPHEFVVGGGDTSVDTFLYGIEPNPVLPLFFGKREAMAERENVIVALDQEGNDKVYEKGSEVLVRNIVDAAAEGRQWRSVPFLNNRYSVDDVRHAVHAYDQSDKGGLIGKYQVVDTIQLDDAVDTVSFTGRHVDSGAVEKIELTISHRLGEAEIGDLFYDGYEYEVTEAMIDWFYLNFTEVVVIKENKYGIHGLARNDMICISERFLKNELVLLHEVGEAMADAGKINAAEIMTYVKNRTWFDAKIQKNTNKNMEVHYALRALFRELFSYSDNDLSYEIKGHFSLAEARAYIREKAPSSKSGILMREFRKMRVLFATREQEQQVLDTIIAKELRLLENVARSEEELARSKEEEKQIREDIRKTLNLAYTIYSEREKTYIRDVKETLIRLVKYDADIVADMLIFDMHERMNSLAKIWREFYDFVLLTCIDAQEELAPILIQKLYDKTFSYMVTFKDRERFQDQLYRLTVVAKNITLDEIDDFVPRLKDDVEEFHKTRVSVHKDELAFVPLETLGRCFSPAEEPGYYYFKDDFFDDIVWARVPYVVNRLKEVHARAHFKSAFAMSTFIRLIVANREPEGVYAVIHEMEEGRYSHRTRQELALVLSSNWQSKYLPEYTTRLIRILNDCFTEAASEKERDEIMQTLAHVVDYNQDVAVSETTIVAIKKNLFRLVKMVSATAQAVNDLEKEFLDGATSSAKQTRKKELDLEVQHLNTAMKYCKRHIRLLFGMAATLQREKEQGASLVGKTLLWDLGEMFQDETWENHLRGMIMSEMRDHFVSSGNDTMVAAFLMLEAKKTMPQNVHLPFLQAFSGKGERTDEVIDLLKMSKIGQRNAYFLMLQHRKNAELLARIIEDSTLRIEYRIYAFSWYAAQFLEKTEEVAKNKRVVMIDHATLAHMLSILGDEAKAFMAEAVHDNNRINDLIDTIHFQDEEAQMYAMATCIVMEGALDLSAQTHIKIAKKMTETKIEGFNNNAYASFDIGGRVLQRTDKENRATLFFQVIVHELMHNVLHVEYHYDGDALVVHLIHELLSDIYSFIFSDIFGLHHEVFMDALRYELLLGDVVKDDYCTVEGHEGARAMLKIIRDRFTERGLDIDWKTMLDVGIESISDPHMSGNNVRKSALLLLEKYAKVVKTKDAAALAKKSIDYIEYEESKLIEPIYAPFRQRILRGDDVDAVLNSFEIGDIRKNVPVTPVPVLTSDGEHAFAIMQKIKEHVRDKSSVGRNHKKANTYLDTEPEYVLVIDDVKLFEYEYSLMHEMALGRQIKVVPVSQFEEKRSLFDPEATFLFCGVTQGLYPDIELEMHAKMYFGEDENVRVALVSFFQSILDALIVEAEEQIHSGIVRASGIKGLFIDLQEFVVANSDLVEAMKREMRMRLIKTAA